MLSSLTSGIAKRLSLLQQHADAPTTLGQIPEYLRQLQQRPAQEHCHPQAAAAARHLLTLAQRGENERWNISDEGGIPILLHVLQSEMRTTAAIHTSTKKAPTEAETHSWELQETVWEVLAQLFIEKGQHRRHIARQGGIVKLLVDTFQAVVSSAAGSTQSFATALGVVKPCCDCILYLTYRREDPKVLQELAYAGVHLALARLLWHCHVQIDPTRAALLALSIILHNCLPAINQLAKFQETNEGTTGIRSVLLGWKFYPMDAVIVNRTLMIIAMLSTVVSYRIELLQHGVHADILRLLLLCNSKPTAAAAAAVSIENQSMALKAISIMTEDVRTLQINTTNEKTGKTSIQYTKTGNTGDVETVRNTFVAKDSVKVLLLCLERYLPKETPNLRRDSSHDSREHKYHHELINARIRCVTSLRNLVFRPTASKTIRNKLVSAVLTGLPSQKAISIISLTLQRHGMTSPDLVEGTTCLLMILINRSDKRALMQPKFVQVGTVESLTDILRVKNQKPLAVKYACSSLGLLLHQNREARLRFNKADGAAVILSLACLFPKRDLFDKPNKAYQCVLDGVCLFFTKAFHNYSRENDDGEAEILTKFMNRKGMDALAKVPVLYSDSVPTTGIALIAMSMFMTACLRYNRYKFSQGCDMFVLSNAVPNTIEAMKRFPGSSVVQEYGFRCLLIFLALPSTKRRHTMDVMAQIAGLIAPSLRKHSSSKYIQDFGCRLVSQLKKVAPLALAKAKDELLPVVKEVTSNFPQNTQLQQVAENALKDVISVKSSGTTGQSEDEDATATVVSTGHDGVMPTGEAASIEMAVPLEFSHLPQHDDFVPLVPAISLSPGDSDDLASVIEVLEATAVIDGMDGDSAVGVTGEAMGETVSASSVTPV